MSLAHAAAERSTRNVASRTLRPRHVLLTLHQIIVSNVEVTEELTEDSCHQPYVWHKLKVENGGSISASLTLAEK